MSSVCDCDGNPVVVLWGSDGVRFHQPSPCSLVPARAWPNASRQNWAGRRGEPEGGLALNLRLAHSRGVSVGIGFALTDVQSPDVQSLRC